MKLYFVFQMLRFLVLIAIVLALSEAIPAGPWYNIGERVKVTWSNDDLLKSMGRPLNPPVFRPQDRAARQGRSADTYAPLQYAGLVTHPNRAVVPVKPEDVIAAREEHLTAHAAA